MLSKAEVLKLKKTAGVWADQHYDPDLQKAVDEILRLRELLAGEVGLLTKWIRETQVGGWSTQHVGPMQERMVTVLNAVDLLAPDE